MTKIFGADPGGQDHIVVIHIHDEMITKKDTFFSRAVRKQLEGEWKMEFRK